MNFLRSSESRAWASARQKYDLVLAASRMLMNQEVHNNYTMEELRFFLRTKDIDDFMFDMAVKIYKNTPYSHRIYTIANL